MSATDGPVTVTRKKVNEAVKSGLDACYRHRGRPLSAAIVRARLRMIGDFVKAFKVENHGLLPSRVQIAEGTGMTVKQVFLVTYVMMNRENEAKRKQYVQYGLCHDMPETCGPCAGCLGPCGGSGKARAGIGCHEPVRSEQSRTKRPVSLGLGDAREVPLHLGCEP